jgi:aminopeptidase N
MRTDTPKTIHLKNYEPPAYDIESVHLHFDLQEEFARVTSTLSIRKLADVPMVLDGQELKLVSVSLNGKLLESGDYACDENHLTIPQVPQHFELQIITEIRPQENTSLEGLFKSSGNFCTQCEAEGFRKITYYLDRPDVMSIFTTTIEAERERYPMLLSNGNLVEQGESPDGRHWVRWHDPYRKPCYLFALVAGNLRYQQDEYTTTSGRVVTLRIYVEPENIDKCDHAMASLKKAMAWDEQKFGLEYDLDIYMLVAVSDFNMGAMENKGLNVFNSKYVLASPDTATDSDYGGIESVIAHEYFHNWTGNRVTCRDWFQLSLKEGLTVYRDQEFSSDMTARTVQRIQDVRALRTYQFAEDGGPMAHPVRPQSYVEINNFYTTTVYNKGAEVVRMYQSMFGVEGFRKGMDLYFQRHDGQAVTTDDFCAAMADANETDLTQFKRWYDQAGTPEVSVDASYEPDEKIYRLRMKQTCPPTPGQDGKQPYMIPIVTGLLDAAGNQMTSSTADAPVNEDGSMVLVLRETEQEFTFTDIPEKPVPSLLRGFSAPVKLHYPYSDEELAFLMVHDSDGFNRWEAAHSLWMRTLGNIIAELGHGREYPVPDSLILSVRTLLEDNTLDQGLLAEMLMLPSESYIAEEQTDLIDVDRIHAASLYLKKTVAHRLKSGLTRLYEKLENRGPYAFTAQDVARRRLRNVTLDYLMELDNTSLRQRCLQQFLLGNNMTDCMAAMECLSHHDTPEREEAYATFYQRWQSDPLVLDKWFSVQARSRCADTLQRVRGLLQHPAFSIRNPNKVRAVIGAFAAGNPVHFHARDGSGYAFLAEQILALDSLNPQIAARLLQSLSRWKRYEPVRAGLMQAQLQRIVAVEGLSMDCYEIASKSLS